MEKVFTLPQTGPWPQPGAQPQHTHSSFAQLLTETHTAAKSWAHLLLSWSDSSHRTAGKGIQILRELRFLRR